MDRIGIYRVGKYMGWISYIYMVYVNLRSHEVARSLPSCPRRVWY